MFELSPVGCRVIGALLEKERTVPATYPLTLKALVSACNQTTGRDPIMTVTEHDVSRAIVELREVKLARTVHASHGARSEKYRQVLDEVLGLDGAQRAVITLLLLRSAQTPGELRSRSERLHPFESVEQVDEALEQLAGRDEPLVLQLDRRPGQKEQRWIHLLGREADRTRHADEAQGVDTSAHATPAARSSDPLPTEPLPAELVPLAAFVGTWTGSGQGAYPTIEPFAFTETITLLPVAGKAMLAYRSATRAADDGRTLHGESGFLRSLGDGSVELVVAQGSGVVEVAEGLVDDRELMVASTLVAGTSTAKEVSSVDRRYRVDGDQLSYELSMSAVGQPQVLHLTGTLTRQA